MLYTLFSLLTFPLFPFIFLFKTAPSLELCAEVGGLPYRSVVVVVFFFCLIFVRVYIYPLGMKDQKNET